MGKASAVMPTLLSSVVIKIVEKAKLAVIIPILTYGYESWVMTKKIWSLVSASEMRFCKESRNYMHPWLFGIKLSAPPLYVPASCFRYQSLKKIWNRNCKLPS